MPTLGKSQAQPSFESALAELETAKARGQYFLSDRQVDVIETREHFLVALPLLEMAAHPETIRA